MPCGLKAGTGRTVRKLAVAGVVLTFAACSHAPLEQSGGHVLPEKAAPQGNVPAPVQISPIVPTPKPSQRPETYSVVVNGVKVQELLFALARDAKLNIDIHPGIAGTVTLNAVDQTLQQLLSRISKQVDMRWELDGPNLAVMPDSPYLRIYKVDYLNMERDTRGTVGVSTQIATPGTQTTGGTGGGGGAAGGSNLSTTTINNIADNKFWARLVENIKDILRETDKILPGAGPVAAVQQLAGAGPSGALQQLAAGAGTPGATAVSVPNVNFREAASVIANPEAGVLTIRATSRQHEKIQEFLDQVLVSAKRQVLIEATIAEVQLNNQYQQGIDWHKFLSGSGTAGFDLAQTTTPATAVINPVFTLGYVAAGINATVRLLDSFGNVRVLSSPRLSVINNQTAVLKVVDNEVYFTIKADTTQSANVGTLTTVTTTPNIVPVGFVMNITPQISDTDTVLLNVKPTISSKIRDVPDPNPLLANPCPSSPVPCAPITSTIPLIQTREMESMIKVNSGQIAVLGGLIQDSINDIQDTVPILGSIPGLGSLFTSRNKANKKTELVIFMRPVVVKDPSLDGDYRAYRTMLPEKDFMQQPNPGMTRPLQVSP